MTKNGSNALNKRTVTVLSQDGEPAGLTYPKRAAGLVRKGRARFVNDNTIRLEYSVSDVTKITEDIKMDNINKLSELSELSKLSEPGKIGEIGEPTENTGSKQQENPVTPEQPINRLFFNAREWSFNKDCKNNVGSRSFMQGPDGIINEAFTIGDWSHNWTEIVTKSLILPKHTLHTFTFWLNGGENDQNDEVCRLEVIFNNDWENRYTFNLNRNFIKPLKKCRGWELYEIPFVTADNEYTQLKFVAMRAYMTVMNAKPASEYADLPDIPDEFEGERPQRHNIVFDDGFPTNTWYSTRNLRNKEPQKSGKAFNYESVLPDELMSLADSLPPTEKAELIRDIMMNRSAEIPPIPTTPPIPATPAMPSQPGYSPMTVEARSELIGMILKAGLPVDIANTLLTNLIGPDGKISKGMIEGILAKQSLSEETAERLKRLNEVLQTIPTTLDNAEAAAREMNSLNAAVSDMAGRISSMVEVLTDSLNEEISMHIQNAVESALNEAADDDSDIDPDYIADTVVSQFEDRITDLTDAITDSLDGLSDQISDAIDELNDRIDELSDD